MSGTNQNMNNTTNKIIWFALLFSLFAYAAVLFTLAEPPEDSPDEVISIVLFLIGCLNIGVGTFGVDIFMNVESRDQYMTTNIIKWALIESAVIMGLANGFIGGGNQVFLGLLTLAVLGFLKTFPKGWSEPEKEADGSD